MNETFESGDVTYEWSGGFGAMFMSYERGVREGDVRILKGRLFYAYKVVRRPFRTSEIWWTVQNVTCDIVRRFKAQAFDVECPALPPDQDPKA